MKREKRKEKRVNNNNNNNTNKKKTQSSSFLKFRRVFVSLYMYRCITPVSSLKL